MTELTVYIGRFSPFHNGHADVLSRALLSSKNVLVLIGSSYGPRTIKNPFLEHERASMILSWYNNNKTSSWGTLDIRYIADHPYNDSAWIAEVQEQVLACMRYLDITGVPTLTGANRDESTWYLKAFGDFFNLNFMAESQSTVGFGLSATKVRELYFEHALPKAEAVKYVPLTTVMFLRNFEITDDFKSLEQEYASLLDYKEKWSVAPFAPTFVTVDTVVIQSGHVLVVGRKNSPGRGLWALPGGFIEAGERIVDSALRELNGETKIELAPAQLRGSIVCSEVFDEPNRSLRGRTITHAFLLQLQDTKNLPKVKPQKSECLWAEWKPLSEALSKETRRMWFEDHQDILKTMYGRLKF